MQAWLGSQSIMSLNDVTWKDDSPSGRMLGDIGIEEASRRPYYLQFTLKLRANLLNGPASAISQPGLRDGSGLTQWVELKKD